MGDQELFDAVRSEVRDPVDLTTVKEKAKELRDSYLQKQDIEAQLQQVDKRITDIERSELPDLFSQVGVSRIDVEPDGNHPGFVAERKTVYTAKIPDEHRQDAFEWLEQQGHGDLVKSVINIIFGMQEHDKRLAVMKLLSDHGIEFYNNESVHASTLKAFVKREIQAGRIIPQDLLGVFIFDEVKIK